MTRPAKDIVLLVDDMPQSLGSLVQELETDGYTVLIADSGAAALERMDLIAPDAVLMAVEAPGITSDRPDRLPTDIRTTATAYLESVRAHQAEGPYRLLGYSFGGVLAYEMARQLREQGESVALVGILDTANPAVAWRRYSARERLGVFLQSRKGQAKSRILLAVAGLELSDLTAENVGNAARAQA